MAELILLRRNLKKKAFAQISGSNTRRVKPLHLLNTSPQKRKSGCQLRRIVIGGQMTVPGLVV
jgi:hypothetical protein